MEKVINYIKNGKGYGLLFLLASAVLMTIFFMFLLKNMFNETRPLLITAAEDILPLTIQNKKIIEPDNTYKRVEIKLSDKDGDVVPVVLDTRGDVFEAPNKASGIYVTKDMLYMVTPQKIEKVTYSDGVFDMATFQELLDYLIMTFSFVSSVLVIGIIFIILLIKTLLLMFFGKLGYTLFKLPEEERMPNDALMRLGALVISGVEVVLHIISFYFPLLHLDGIQRFIIEVAFVFIFLYKKKQIN